MAPRMAWRTCHHLPSFVSPSLVALLSPFTSLERGEKRRRHLCCRLSADESEPPEISPRRAAATRTFISIWLSAAGSTPEITLTSQGNERVEHRRLSRCSAAELRITAGERA